MGMWAQEETLASFSNSDNEGWTISGSPSYSSTGGYQLVSSDKSITSPSINFSNYKNVNITITARKYGGPNTTQGKISVKQGSTELATYSPSSTTLTASNALAISPSDGTLTISCPGASSSKGCGISAIVIKGTPKGDSPEPTDPDPEPELKGYNSGTLGYNAFNLIPEGTNIYAQPNVESHSITFDGISLTLTKNSGTSLRFDEGYVRVYQKNTMTITAPIGRKIAKIELNKAGGDWKDGMTVSPTCSPYKDGDETPTWTGSATSVSFTPGGTHRLASVTVYLEPREFDLTIGSSEWASMYLDFAAEVPEDVTAYYAASVDNEIITLRSVEAGEVLPAKTGVLVNGSSCTFKESTAEAADVTGNLFEGVTTATPCETRTVWVLNTTSTAALGDPVLSLYTGTSLGANKAYLPASKVAGAKSLKLVFDDNTATGINAVSNATTNNVAYNLAGQRVAANAKGIVIVNGKKFINK